MQRAIVSGQYLTLLCIASERFYLHTRRSRGSKKRNAGKNRNTETRSERKCMEVLIGFYPNKLFLLILDSPVSSEYMEYIDCGQELRPSTAGWNTSGFMT